MKKQVLLLFTFLSIQAFSQVGIGTEAPEAALDVVSETSGILIPRMSAIQIEQMQEPTEGELVFSNSDDGITINMVGFWYFDGTEWSLISASSSSGENLYNNDGAIATDRFVNLNNYNLNFGPNKLFISGNETGNIGIMTANPTEMLDINGNLRIRNLSSGNLISTIDGLLTIDNGTLHKFGDIRYSTLETDHEGWYLLDGRAISSLPADVQSRAVDLGINNFLPEGSGKYIKQGIPGQVTGAASVVLSQNNMPDFNLTRSTNSVSHNHQLLSPGFTTIRGTNLRQGRYGTGNYWHLAGGAEDGSPYATQSYITTSNGSHSHTVSVPTGGRNLPLNLNPSNIQLNYFIYLGT